MFSVVNLLSINQFSILVGVAAVSPIATAPVNDVSTDRVITTSSGARSL